MIIPARPALVPLHLKKGYVLLAPLATHWRPATCEEVRCRAFTDGFEIVLPDSPGRVERIAYLRADRSRVSTEWRRPDGAVVFRFPPGTRPFAGATEHENHRVRIDRPEICAVKDRLTDPASQWVVHDGPNGGADNWVDDFAGHQDKLFTAAQKG